MTDIQTQLQNEIPQDALIVIDISAVVNIGSMDELQTLVDFIVERELPVAVTKSFYENYNVIMKSDNQEQKNLASKIWSLMSQLRDSGKLQYADSIVSPIEIIEKLHKSKKVCFIYFEYSEFSESIQHFADSLDCKAIVIDRDGKIVLCTKREQILAYSRHAINLSLVGDEYFDINFQPKKGTTVFTEYGEPLILADQLGVGGEGAVYSCYNHPSYAAKIYHNGQLNKLRLTKIFRMVDKKIQYDGICWPELVIYNNKKEPLGYVMKKIDGLPLELIIDGPEQILRYFPTWTKKNLVLLTLDILQKIQYLHLFGILIGDLRMRNIVIRKDGTPIIVDIDSCQIESLPSPAGDPDYTPPEMQSVAFKKQLRTYYNENFSCSVLMFKLLFCGRHPYDQKYGSDTITEDIAKRAFPYPPTANGDYSKIPWGGYASMWQYTPMQMQAFLYNIFKNGARYSLNEMIMMLKTYYQFLQMNPNAVGPNIIYFKYN